MEIYTLEPAASRSWLYLILIGLLLVGILALVIHTRYAMTHTRFELGDDNLRIVSGLRSRTIPLSSLDTTGARVVNFEQEPELRVVSRRGGTAIGDYRTGWFRLKNREKALLYMTGRKEAVYIPTSLGYSLLLNVSEQDNFLASLHRK